MYGLAGEEKVRSIEDCIREDRVLRKRGNEYIYRARARIEDETISAR